MGVDRGTVVAGGEGVKAHTVVPVSVLVCRSCAQPVTQERNDDGTIAFRHLTQADRELMLAEAARDAASRFVAAAE